MGIVTVDVTTEVLHEFLDRLPFGFDFLQARIDATRYIYRVWLSVPSMASSHCSCRFEKLPDGFTMRFLPQKRPAPVLTYLIP